MNFIKPIPAELLTDFVTLITPTKRGEASELITDVRVIRKDKLSENPARDTSEITVYYDCVNSSPGGIEFKIGQSLVYLDERYEITQTELFQAITPHHFRIKAVKIIGE